jgi:hypothetical protein
MTDYQFKPCSCKACQGACETRPGWFTPDQIAPLAEALGVTVQVLFDEHLSVDWWSGDPDIFVLAPRMSNDSGGGMYPADPRGRCHWLVDGKCSIHDLGKPYECQKAHHSLPPDAHTKNHEAAANAWRTDEHQKTIKELYGDEPVAEELGLLDYLLGGSW